MAKVLVEIKGKGGYWEGNKGGQTALPGRPHVLINTTAVSARIAKGFFNHLGNLNEAATDEKYKKLHFANNKDSEKTQKEFLATYGEKVKVEDSLKKEAELDKVLNKEALARAEAEAKKAEAEELVDELSGVVAVAQEAVDAAKTKVAEAEKAVADAAPADAKAAAGVLKSAKDEEIAATKALEKEEKKLAAAKEALEALA